MNIEVPSASMTFFLIAVSVGRWFMVLSFGCTRFHACFSAASLAANAINKCCEVCGGRRYWWIWSDLDWLHHWVVGRIAD